MGIYTVKPRFQSALAGIADRLTDCQVRADTLTAAGVATSALGAAALTASTVDPRWLLVVPLAAIARLSLNALDGMVAQRSGTARPWGLVLNELGDRTSDLLLLFGLGAAAGQPLAGALVASLALFASQVGVLGLAAGGRREYGGLMGKADRMVVLALGAGAAALTAQRAWLEIALAVIAAGLVLTIGSRLRSVHNDLESVR